MLSIHLRLGLPRWLYNIKMDLGEIGYSGMDQSGYGYAEVSCEHGHSPSGYRNCQDILDSGFSKWDNFHGVIRITCHRARVA
jgi:hypothetical protein